jgi:putative peptidoglycan lipid II flippase
LPVALVGKLWLGAAMAAAVAWGIKLLMGTAQPRLLAVLALIPYGMVYFAVTWMLGVPEVASTLGRVRSALRRR